MMIQQIKSYKKFNLVWKTLAKDERAKEWSIISRVLQKRTEIEKGNGKA